MAANRRMRVCACISTPAPASYKNLSATPLSDQLRLCRAALIPTAGRKNNLTRRCTANMALCIAYLGRLLLDVALHLGAGQRAQQQRREDLGRFLLLGSCVHVVVEVG